LINEEFQILGMLRLELFELSLVLLTVFHVVDLRDTNLELVLGSRVCNYLPVMNTFSESNVPKNISEYVFIFLDVDLPVVRTDL
jgi:hypothetical protein